MNKKKIKFTKRESLDKEKKNVKISKIIIYRNIYKYNSSQNYISPNICKINNILKNDKDIILNNLFKNLHLNIKLKIQKMMNNLILEFIFINLIDFIFTQNIIIN